MSNEIERVHARIYKAWSEYTRQTANFNLNLGFKKGNATDPDFSCTIVLYNYANTFTGTMTHLGRRQLDKPVTGEWYALRGPALEDKDLEAPQFVSAFGDTFEEAMLAAEEKMHARFASPSPKDTL